MYRVAYFVNHICTKLSSCVDVRVSRSMSYIRLTAFFISIPSVFIVQRGEPH